MPSQGMEDRRRRMIADGTWSDEDEMGYIKERAAEDANRATQQAAANEEEATGEEHAARQALGIMQSAGQSRGQMYQGSDRMRLDDWQQGPGAAGFEQQQGLVGQGLADLQGRENIGVDYGRADPWAAQMQGLYGDLAGVASGAQQGMGSLQFQQGLDQSIAAQSAMAKSQAGLSPAAAARQAGMAGERMQLQGGQQAAMIAMQEQQAARAAMGQLGMGMGQQENQRGQFGAGLDVQQRQMYDQAYQNFLAQGMDVASAQMAAEQFGRDLYFRKYQTDTNAALGAASQVGQMGAQESERRSNIASGAIQAGGAFLGALSKMSDKRAKKDIADAGPDMDSFLKALKAKSYDYKDPDKPYTGHGRRYGFMAQDAEKSEVGKHLVMDTPDGKMVDVGRVAMTALAAAAHLAKKMEAKK